ncbi:hypothetical protein D3C71_2167980 [compost metagenome]
MVKVVHCFVKQIIVVFAFIVTRYAYADEGNANFLSRFEDILCFRYITLVQIWRNAQIH